MGMHLSVAHKTIEDHRQALEQQLPACCRSLAVVFLIRRKVLAYANYDSTGC